MKKRLLALVAILTAAPVCAEDIVIIGETHDNPYHHVEQAGLVARIAPSAVVFEMLTPEQNDGTVLPRFSDPAELPEFLGWAGSGWPDFEMYRPIFDAAPEARIYGAGVPRDKLTGDTAGVFGPDAAAYGLNDPLPPEEQALREAGQMQAHCDALPEEMLPVMVDIQRLRDAALARAALRALDEAGAPVVVIAGNGHARKDWGVPAHLARLRPGVSVRAIGQTEEDAAIEGGFDEVLSSPAAERGDPCAAFR